MPWRGAMKGPTLASAPAAPKPLFPQFPRVRDLLGVGSATLLASGLDHERKLLEAGLGKEGRAALGAELALADVRVAVAVGAERRLGVVEVQRAQPVETDRRVEVVEHAAQ